MLPGPLSPELGLSVLNSYMWSTSYDARGLLDLERILLRHVSSFALCETRDLSLTLDFPQLGSSTLAAWQAACP